MNEHPVTGAPLSRGFMLANQHVLERIAVDPLGDRYAVLFGTTNRMYDVNVDAGPEAVRTHAAYEAHLSRVLPLRHPCLIPFFACGEDAGIAWIRSAHCLGAPDWVTASAPLEKTSPGDEEAEPVCFETLRALLDVTGGRIAAKDRNIIIGDLAEAIAHLHEHDAYAGVLTPETVFLDKTFRRSEMIARLRFYAWPEATTRQQQADDLRQAAELIKVIQTACEPSRPGHLGRALLALAETLRQGDTLGDGQGFYESVCEVLEANGAFHKPRKEKRPPAYAADGTVVQPFVVKDAGQTPLVAGVQSRHRSSHHRHRRKPRSRRFDSTSATGQMVAATFRMGLMFLGIVGVGFGVYFTMRHLDQRRRAEQLITSAERYSAISIIEDETDRPAEADLPADIRAYTPEQLKAASERGNARASARLAVMKLAENPADPGNRAGAEAILAPHLSRLEVEAVTNPDAAYWHGYVLLLGLGGTVDPDPAIVQVERASEAGYADARILLGDWLIQRTPGGSAEDDRLALQHWRTAFGRPVKWTATHHAAIDRIIFMVRAGRGFKSDDSDLGALIEHAAEAGHPEAMRLVSELYDSGRLREARPSTALSWLRRLVASPGAPEALRAETQRRMADMFAAGRGTPGSLSAARIWYERAARKGSREAMLSLADLCESGEGAEDGRRTPEEARYWRKEAASAEPVQPKTLPSRLFK